MNKFQENQPNAAILLESLRSSGYDNYSAIADLIDNSFDANADEVKINISGSDEKNKIITIADNGDGMDRDTLDEALRLGSSTNRSEDSLGKFGMGLITASISMGKKLVVVTKYSGKFLTGIHDLELVEKEKKFVKEVRESTDLERNAFINKLGYVKSGTLVAIQKIDNVHNKNNTIFINTLTKKLGEIFRDFINTKKNISINEKMVYAVDPMFRDQKSEELIDVSKDFTCDENTATVRLKIYHLPKFSASESRELKVNQLTQGFYVMRNNRQIAGGQSLGIFTKHNYRNRFRAEIYFSGKLDKAMGINFKKENVVKTAEQEDIYNWLESLSTPQIEAIYNIAKNKATEKLPDVDHNTSKKVIENKSSLLKKPRIIQTGSNKQLKSLRSDDFSDVEFAVEHNTHLAPLYQIDYKGNKITIRYNADHIFYINVLKETAGDNIDLVNAIDFMIYSSALSLINISSTEDTLHLKDDFIDNMSDNLRALLS